MLKAARDEERGRKDRGNALHWYPKQSFLHATTIYSHRSPANGLGQRRFAIELQRSIPDAVHRPLHHKLCKTPHACSRTGEEKRG